MKKGSFKIKKEKFHIDAEIALTTKKLNLLQ